jgi:hypothetical protein
MYLFSILLDERTSEGSAYEQQYQQSSCQVYMQYAKIFCFTICLHCENPLKLIFLLIFIVCKIPSHINSQTQYLFSFENYSVYISI